MGKVLKIGCGVVVLIIAIIAIIIAIILTIAGDTIRDYSDDLGKMADSIRVADSIEQVTEPKDSGLPEVDYDWLLTEAQYAVKQSLHDPESADFKFIDESNITYYPVDDPRIKEFKDLGRIYVVWGEVRAKNALGATVLSTYAVDIQFTHEGNYIIRGIEIE